MRKVNDNERKQIVSDIVSEFPCFGRGAEGGPSGFIATFGKDSEPFFALGVDVRKVVDYILERIK